MAQQKSYPVITLQDYLHKNLEVQDLASFLCDSQLRSLTIEDYTVLISNPLVRMFAQEPLVPDLALFLYLV